MIEAAQAQPTVSLMKPKPGSNSSAGPTRGSWRHRGRLHHLDRLRGPRGVGCRSIQRGHALWIAGADGRVVELTEHQSKNPPIGSGVAAPTSFAAKLPHSWLILAMSDGAWKSIGRDGIREALRTSRGREWLDGLLAGACLPRSGELQDDFTAVLLQAPV